MTLQWPYTVYINDLKQYVHKSYLIWQQKKTSHIIEQHIGAFFQHQKPTHLEENHRCLRLKAMKSMDAPRCPTRQLPNSKLVNDGPVKGKLTLPETNSS